MEWTLTSVFRVTVNFMWSPSQTNVPLVSRPLKTSLSSLRMPIPDNYIWLTPTHP